VSDREEFEAHIKGTAWHQVLSGASKDDDEGASVFRMAMIAASEAWQAARATPADHSAKQRYDELNASEDSLEPLERLRFFCSLAMSGQDWLDVEEFFDAVIGSKPADYSRDSVIEECVSKIQLLGDSWVPWDYVAELRALKEKA
jgi:hypothetical protein